MDEKVEAIKREYGALAVSARKVDAMTRIDLIGDVTVYVCPTGTRYEIGFHESLSAQWGLCCAWVVYGLVHLRHGLARWWEDSLSL